METKKQSQMEVIPLLILSVSILLFSIATSGAAPLACDVNIDPSRVVVRFGDPVTVNCSTTREDILEAAWEASVNPVNKPNSATAVWNVSSLTVWDAEPKCFINCRSEPRQCLGKLDLVIYKYPESVSLIAPEFMKIGVESNITCQVLDVAPARYLSVKLYKGDEELGNRSFTHDSTRFPVNASVPFPVTPTRADNGSEYTCVAELQLGPGEPIQNSSLPFRMFPIDFEEQPILTVSENVEVNQTSTVRCELKNAFPAEEVQAKLLINNKIHTERSNMDNVYVEESFTLDSAEPAMIECHVSLRSLSKSTNKTIQGYVLPEPTVHTEAVLVNHTGIVTCSVNGSVPETATQRLLLNGFPVNESHNSAPTQYVFKAEKELNGKVITCETELNLAAASVKKNQSATLSVLYPPTIKTRFPASKDLKEGEKLSSHFDCEAEGNPPPKTVWLKDSKEFDSSKILMRGDGGVYQLKTVNKLGSATATVTVTVGYEPSVINPAEESVPVVKGDSVVFNCTAEAIPSPTYTWKHPEADNVNTTTRDNVSTLTITGVSSSNEGVYECHAWNIHGNSTRKVTVIVIDYLLPLIAGVAALFVLLILILIIVLYRMYYKRHKTGEYSLKAGKPSSANGSMAHNGKGAEEIPLTPI